MFRHIRRSALALGILASVTGCSVSSSSDATAADDLVNQSSSDITVLKVNVIEAINGYGAPGFSAEQCKASADGQTVNCTAELERRFGAPALHEVVLAKRSVEQGSQFFCRVMHVTTLTKHSAAEATTGVGFYYRGYTYDVPGGDGRFVPKADMKKVGEATRKDGAPADLHEFIGLANCWLGSATGSSRVQYEFKPYAAFEANGERYQNWDTVSRNHSVDTTHPAWDRSSELLRQ